MNKRTIRDKKPEWKEWTYIVVDSSDARRMIEELRADGYIVEG